MAKSQVYFIGPRTGKGRAMFAKLGKLLEQAGFSSFFDREGGRFGANPVADFTETSTSGN